MHLEADIKLNSEMHFVMAWTYGMCPGQVTPISHSRLITSHKSALRILPLNSTYTLTQINVGNHHPKITMQALTQPDVGVHATTLFLIYCHWIHFAHGITRFDPFLMRRDTLRTPL